MIRPNTGSTIAFANEKREEGLSPLDAIHAAGMRRFRPILLTTLTTFGGLAPMIFETSRQARYSDLQKSCPTEARQSL